MSSRTRSPFQPTPSLENSPHVSGRPATVRLWYFSALVGAGRHGPGGHPDRCVARRAGRDRQRPLRWTGLRFDAAEEWVAFAAAARADPQPFLDRQAKFIEASGIVTDPEQVYANFAALFEAVARRDCASGRLIGPAAPPAIHRQRPCADASIELRKAARRPGRRGEVFSDLLTEQEMRRRAWPARRRAPPRRLDRRAVDRDRANDADLLPLQRPGVEADARLGAPYIASRSSIISTTICWPFQPTSARANTRSTTAPERLETVRSAARRRRPGLRVDRSPA